MQLHELLTETRRRFLNGSYKWAQGTLAFAGDPHLGAPPVEPIDPRATHVCLVGGLCRTAGAYNAPNLYDLYPTLPLLLANAIDTDWLACESEDDWSPATAFNDDRAEDKDEIIDLLERAAALATPPDPED